MVKAGKKKRILRWRGLLSDLDRRQRAMVAVLLVLASAALTFAQLGFVGIGFGEGQEAYAIVLLQPIALAALLLGVWPGVCVGLLAGIVLYTHAAIMPSDFYELAFVTPVTSILMLSVTGFMLGLFFAVALRNDPSPVKSSIYIAIVCIVVSWLYSIGFFSMVIMTLIVNLSNMDLSNLTDAELDELAGYKASEIAMRIGKLDLQAWANAGMMAIVCVIGYFIVRKLKNVQERISLRVLFGLRSFAVVLLAFMVIAPASFVAITFGDLEKARASMDSEISYICKQIQVNGDKANALWALFDSIGFDLGKASDAEFNDALTSISSSKLLDGYSEEVDGTLIVSSDGYVELSDDPRFEIGSNLDDSLNNDVLEAIELSASTGEMQRVIDDDSNSSKKGIEDVSSSVIKSHIDYVLARRQDDCTVTAMMPSSMVFEDRASDMARATLMSFVLLAIVFALTERLLSLAVVRRIDEINGVLGRITEGNLDERVDVHDTREFGSLSEGINTTVVALKGWIAEAETRMDAELSTAKAIQESALPRTFPPFPDIERFDIFALMHAAKEVGGDFYDFFLIGDGGSDSGKLGFVIADVSGKGVPAALFMMNAKALIRNYMESEMELGEAFENANRQLCDGNDAGMFVTVWAGVLDYGEGSITFVNAGHNPPLIWQAGSWRWVTERSGLPLGLFDGLPYRTYSLECQIGDELLLYTDGVTEAMNAQGVLYGEDRLEEVVRLNYTAHPRELSEIVRHDVAEHAGGAEQSDDITILALEVGVPPEITATLMLPATVEMLPRVNEFIHTELDRRLCPLRTQSQIDIAVEELFVNVAHYAYPDATADAPGMARVSYTYSADPVSVRIDIADNGIPYNPLAKPDAVTPDDIADVPIGGLGILMAKRSVDEMAYERVNDSNIVTIVKKW